MDKSLKDFTFWDYMKGKIWWIVLLLIYFTYRGYLEYKQIGDLAVGLGAMLGPWFGLVIMVGIFYLLYKNKITRYKKLKEKGGKK